jgi:hypothetical protein
MRGSALKKVLCKKKNKTQKMNYQPKAVKPDSISIPKKIYLTYLESNAA